MAKHVIDYIMSYAPNVMFKEFSRKYYNSFNLQHLNLIIFSFYTSFSI